MTNPADLYERTRDALGQLRDLRRTLVALSREYADLEPHELAVDNLGEALTAGDAITGVLDGLSTVDRAIEDVDDALDHPLQLASRLGRLQPVRPDGK
ncbi:hypothetical protein [Rhodococcus sp. PD04]|uniref:hypothetical protein n=1 Tax=Rhodococcus sp. PD04 TaxID=3109594 RepID=UPI002DDA82AA|nr:hypothetical protein [Rhodococcus sp. PD04]WSE25801.1 hypothetical protein U9J23_27700 [Rhodococcus sp. PD04]